ncbi:MAG: hypothetical protein KAS82_03580 [Bacteroidales bacterium]|nr:hypothetical protein [Bacteroidales bacterium]
MEKEKLVFGNEIAEPTMKRILIVVSISFLLLSCGKDYLVPEEELPEWLIQRIEYDEQVIEASPKYYLAYGAWSRIKWNNENYYEYFNALSSTILPPISELGDTLDILMPLLTSSDYYKERCCREYVWKGPRYKDWHSGE